MLKKITLIIIMAVLMINCYMGVIYATGDATNKANEVENAEVSSTEEGAKEEEVSKTEIKLTRANAIVIDSGEVTQVDAVEGKDTVQKIKIEILDGEYESREFSIDYVLSYDINGKISAYELKNDDKIIVQLMENTDGNVTATVQDIQRDGYIYVLFALFIASIVLVGGKKGIKTIASLAILMFCIWFILIKGIFAGKNPIWLSIITSAIVITCTFFIIYGINRKAFTAILGSVGGILVTGILAGIFSNFSKLTGVSEDAIQLSSSIKSINFSLKQGIFAGIVISSLGACMDMGLSISNTLDEMKNKSADMTFKELFFSGLEAGRDAIGTMTNTLILALLGGTINIILLYLACELPIKNIIDKETISTSAISALTGSIGVVCTVPLTALAYSILNRNKTIYKTVSDNKLEGKRSLKI